MKILVADDELLIRKAISRILVQKGHLTFEAENGLDALKLWRKEEPDLVLLDFLMPGLNGLEVLKEVEPHLKKKIVVMSAYVGSNEHKDFINHGASHFFSKPFSDIFKFIQEVEEIGYDRDSKR